MGAQADALAALVNQIDRARSEESGNELHSRVELFSINQLAGSSPQLCPIGAMQTLPAVLGKQKQSSSRRCIGEDTIDATSGTNFELVQASDVHTPCVSAPVVVQNSVSGVAHLEALGSLHPPFRINIAGVVVEVGNPQPTVGGSGKPMRTRVISDAKGCYVTVRQLGVERRIQRYDRDVWLSRTS